MAKSAVPDILTAALTCVAKRDECRYTERLGTAYGCRMYSVFHPYKFLFFADCSAADTAWFRWGRSYDPSGFDFSGWGNTATIVANPHNRVIGAEEVRPGDLAFWGNHTYPVHTALVIENDRDDPLVVSHGRPGDPHELRVSEMTGLGPVFYLRVLTMRKPLVRRVVSRLAPKLPPIGATGAQWGL